MIICEKIHELVEICVNLRSMGQKFKAIYTVDRWEITLL
jgi:hypothetical protein